jgi:hypothetical protein
MARVSPIQTNFTAGEWSPRLGGRIDLTKYTNALELLENFIVLPHGGAQKRSGARFVAALKDESQAGRLLRFQFSVLQPYILEATANAFRFYKDEGRIVAGDTDAAISNGTFTAGITDWDNRSTGAASIAHDAPNGRLSLVGAAASVAWAEQDVTLTTTALEHVLRFRVLGAPGDAIELRIGTASTGSQVVADRSCAVGWHAFAFTPGASPIYIQFRNTKAKTLQIDDVALIDNAPVELETIYAAAQLEDIMTAQSADVMYLCHAAQPVHKLLRFGHTTWSLVQVDWINGPYLAGNADAVKTLQPSATSGFGITITATGHSPWSATDVNRLVQLTHSGTTGYAVITGYTSPTVVSADVRVAFGATTATATWRLGAWSATTGYPVGVTFFGARLYCGGPSVSPQRLDGSKVNDLENFTPGATDADAVSFTLAASEVNAIRWLASDQFLFVGTVGGVWIVRASTQEEPITPSNINAIPQTATGTALGAPVRVNDVLLYVQRAARKVIELAFSLERDRHGGNNLTLLAEHITKSGVRPETLCYQEEPDGVAWAARADGVALAATYLREQNVNAWGRVLTGGTNPAIESIAVIPAPDGATDQVWWIARRTINGQTRRYVEFIEEGFDHDTLQAAAFFVDSGLSYAGAPATLMSGLSHLEGQTVAILADGAVEASKVVTGGQITLEAPASQVHIGLSYTAKLKTLRAEAGGDEGAAQGKKKAIHSMIVRLYRTLGLKCGPSEAELDELAFRDAADLMDTAPPLSSGDHVVEWRGGYDREGQMVLVHDTPTPCTIVALIPQLTVNDR